MPGSSSQLLSRRLLGWGLLSLLIGPWLAGCLANDESGTPSPIKDPGTDAIEPRADTRRTESNRSIAGLYPSSRSEPVELRPGEVFQLDARLVTHDVGTGRPVRMFAYNGQIPGPLLLVDAGSEASIEFTNRLPYNTTVHWHGVRLNASADGVPHVSQSPVRPGDSYRYELRFPDEGLFWYHPHVREDMQQELGLYGAIHVRNPADGDGVREVPLLIDDVLTQGDDVAPFYDDEANSVLMGRYGNRFLVNGQPTFENETAPGERVRLLLFNVANARPMQLAFENQTAAELVALDGGYLAAPTPIDRVVLGPSERAIVDVVMPSSGEVTLLAVLPEATMRLAEWRVDASRPPAIDPGAPVAPHERARENMEAALARADEAAPITWDLDVEVGTGGDDPHAVHGGNSVPSAPPADGIEWENADPAGGLSSTPSEIRWIIRDAETGRENTDIEHVFPRDSYVRITIRNLGESLHPMQHPIHIHGQRFLVESIDGQPNPHLAWKDTVLVPAAREVTLLVEMNNPGTWVFHCHTNEHLEAGMEGRFRVE